MGFQRKHPLAECENCDLYAIGRFVPSDGPTSAKFACVGEAPGAQEARSGKPFTGPSGKLLDTILTHHGIKREEVFLTNACLCRPPNNDTPSSKAIQACKGRLLHELRERDADTVIALGNSAAQALLDQSGITKLRVGPGKTSDYLPGVRIIPTLHPAAALRQADFFPHIVTDVGKAVTPNVVWNPPRYVVADDEVAALQLMEAVRERLSGQVRTGATGTRGRNPGGLLVVDIEVDVEKDTSFDHPNKYGMLCVGLGYERGKCLVIGESAMASGRVRDYLGSLLRAYPIICQNGKFDLAGLYPILGGLELEYDTMLASYVFDERPGIHGLKYQAVEYLGAPQYDNEIKQYVGPGVGYGAIPRPKLYKYNATDVVATYEMALIQMERFETLPEGAELRKVHDFLIAASNELMYVELNGIAIDREYLKELDAKFCASLAVLEEEIRAVVSAATFPHDLTYDKRLGFNARSPQQVQKFLADKGVSVDSTNVDTINLIIDRLSDPKYSNFKETEQVLKFCKVLLKHRKEAKLYGTYVKGIRKRMYRGRVYPTFLLHGTTTGRLSCRNPNLQNIPRDSAIRRMFVPAREHNVFIQTDYSQAELRVLSFLARDNYFRNIFNGGERDLFDELTLILYPGANKDELGAAGWKELRIRVKAYVYGLAYGREAGSIASEYNIPRGEAVRGMRAFFDVIPEIVDFREQTRLSVLAGKDLVTPWGRHRRYTLITKENVHDVMNEALAFLPQSTASDMCLMAMGRIRRELKGIGYVRNIVHDSVLVECPQDRVEEVTQIMEAAFVAAGEYIVGDYVKIAVESKVGMNWGGV